jgi:hypothetical protein
VEKARIFATKIPAVIYPGIPKPKNPEATIAPPAREKWSPPAAKWIFTSPASEWRAVTGVGRIEREIKTLGIRRVACGIPSSFRGQVRSARIRIGANFDPEVLTWKYYDEVLLFFVTDEDAMSAARERKA